MSFSTLASIVVVAINCVFLKCEWVVLLFVFLDGKFVPAPKLLNMSYLLCKLFPSTTELQSNKWHYLHHPAIAVDKIESSVTCTEKIIFRQKSIISKNCNSAPRHPKFLRLAFLCTWVCVLNTLWMPSHLDIISFSPFLALTFPDFIWQCLSWNQTVKNVGHSAHERLCCCEDRLWIACGDAEK